MSYWAPKPLRPMGTEGGLFVYEDQQPIQKSQPNRWQQQRREDGTPHTRHTASALMPPPAGPSLVLNDLEKSSKKADESDKDKKVSDEDGAIADLVVKSYLYMHDCLAKGAFDTGRSIGSKIVGAANKVVGLAGTSGKSIEEEEDSPTKLEKSDDE